MNMQMQAAYDDCIRFTRQSDKLDQTSSSVRELRSTLDSSLSAQVGFKGKLDETNRTLQKFHIDLKSTVIRVNNIEEKVGIHCIKNWIYSLDI